MKPLISQEELAELLTPLDAETGKSHSDPDIESFADKPLHLNIEIDDSLMSHHKLMPLKEGSIVPIDEFTAKHLHLYRGDQLLAGGELVQDGNKIAFKITKTFPPPESQR